MKIINKNFLALMLFCFPSLSFAITDKEFNNFKQQCIANDGEACRRLAYEYSLPDGKMPTNIATAMSYYQKGCELKNAQSLASCWLYLR